MYNEKTNIFDPYNGLIRGNMFKDIYDNNNKVFEIKPINEQAELLTYIDMYDFACIDLSLYLDIYPNDGNIIELYNRMNNEKANILNTYENKYGPLSLSSKYYNKEWTWDNSPWPWEV